MEDELHRRHHDVIARIKSEFLLTDHVPTLALDYVTVKDREHLLSGDNETLGNVQPSKRLKYSKRKSNILKGQNKNRGPTFTEEKVNVLCSKLIDIPVSGELPICSNEKCSFLHNIESYLLSKPADISEECYSFSIHGYCPRGLTCRFGKTHITENGRNIRKDNAVNVSYCNFLSKNLQYLLRKRLYHFDKSEKVLHEFDRLKKNTYQNEDHILKSPDEIIMDDPQTVVDKSIPTHTGYVDDSDIVKLKPKEKKKIDWKNKLILSPLTTVGNLPFRRICKELGADVTCGEMCLASSLLQGMQQEWALVRRHESENTFGVQICGNNPYVMTKCAQLLQENIDVDFVDVNLGCPIDQIYRRGFGSGLLLRERILQSILNCMHHTLNIPLTVKTRTGIYKDRYILENVIPIFVQSGVSLISIHGRTREQRYTKLADWNYVEECAKLAGNVPVFGNGDILSFTDYNEKFEKYPHISGALIGRGALYKPWLFTEIKEQRHWDISSSERMDIIKRFVNYGLEHWGSDNKGVESTRRFLLEWMSFLHRYIPVGLLEQVPQTMNQRPPLYRGRNELETLLASPNCKDWITVSEMLLGPVPNGFRFLPKHKASSWK